MFDWLKPKIVVIYRILDNNIRGDIKGLIWIASRKSFPWAKTIYTVFHAGINGFGVAVDLAPFKTPIHKSLQAAEKTVIECCGTSANREKMTEGFGQCSFYYSSDEKTAYIFYEKAKYYKGREIEVSAEHVPDDTKLLGHAIDFFREWKGASAVLEGILQKVESPHMKE